MSDHFKVLSIRIDHEAKTDFLPPGQKSVEKFMFLIENLNNADALLAVLYRQVWLIHIHRPGENKEKLLLTFI
jgi:hypothetical protein